MGRFNRDEGREFGAYERDVIKKNGERLLSFAANCKLALINTFFSPRKKSGISYTHTGSRPNDRKRTDYIILRCQAHRSKVHVVKVHAQPPSRDKPDSDLNIAGRPGGVSGHPRA